MLWNSVQRCRKTSRSYAARARENPITWRDFGENLPRTVGRFSEILVKRWPSVGFGEDLLPMVVGSQALSWSSSPHVTRSSPRADPPIIARAARNFPTKK